MTSTYEWQLLCDQRKETRIIPSNWSTTSVLATIRMSFYYITKIWWVMIQQSMTYGQQEYDTMWQQRKIIIARCWLAKMQRYYYKCAYIWYWKEIWMYFICSTLIQWLWYGQSMTETNMSKMEQNSWWAIIIIILAWGSKAAKKQDKLAYLWFTVVPFINFYDGDCNQWSCHWGYLYHLTRPD